VTNEDLGKEMQQKDGGLLGNLDLPKNLPKDGDLKITLAM